MVNNSIEIIVLILSYILCFIFINIENTEQISIYLFLILHIIFLFVSFFTSNVIWNNPLVFIFAIGWILILVSLSLVINTFRILHDKYYPDPIQLGRDIFLKDIIKNLWVASTIFLWILFLYIKQNIVLNSYNGLLSICIILLSSVNIYLSYTLARHQYTIVIPK